MAQYTNSQLKLVADTIRCLSADAIDKAKSGHPGAALGLADVATVLWLNFLRHDPKCPDWPNRDRFILSGGHASMLLYSLLHLSGYDMTMDDIKEFRQLNSRTPGHPERGPGVEVSTGPLGQGIAMGVGEAIAERMLAERINVNESFKPVDHRTFVFCGDGDLMEGISHEAASLAGHLGLSKLVVFFDNNSITIEGDTSLACSDNVKKRFTAYGWLVCEANGHDYSSITKAIRKAMRSPDKPAIVICNTVIGKGSPNKAGKCSCHGSPLGEDETALLKKALGFDPNVKFHVPQEVYDIFSGVTKRLTRQRKKWERLFSDWCRSNPDNAVAWRRHFGDLPENFERAMPVFTTEKPMATRSASGKVINAIASDLPQLIGGSADLNSSNKTEIVGGGDIARNAFKGRNIHFGIRELAMSAVMNGIAAHGGFRVFGGTFFVFSDYCKPAMRISALMGLPVIYVFSHDSFYVGEDGATHEPVEQLAGLRCMPGLSVIRPADANETATAWTVALKNTKQPTALILTRQDVAVLDRTQLPSATNLERGAYTIFQNGTGTPDITIIATGSEVAISIEAARQIPNSRVVSMPSWDLFAKQDKSYRDSVLDPECTCRLGVEAASSFGWDKWIGQDGEMISLDTYGKSAPYKVLEKEFGFTAENILAKARAMLAAK